MVGGLVLHEYCRSGLQCTGTENAEKCNTDEHNTQGHNVYVTMIISKSVQNVTKVRYIQLILSELFH